MSIMELCLLICLFLFVVLSIVAIIDGRRFVVRTYQIESDKIKSPYSFVVLSDLHNTSFGKKNHKLIEKIKSLKPDGILIAGDMITAKPNVSFENAVYLLQTLSEEYPIFYGNGNHEQRLFFYPETYGNMGNEYVEKLKACHVFPLKNTYTDLVTSNIRISGFEMDRMYYKRFKQQVMAPDYIRNQIGEASREKFQILIAHNPDFMDNYTKWNADLVLSGHIHGGIMRLPFLGGVISPSCTFFPKYDGGKFEQENTTLILSRGLGTHTLPVRIFNPGELVCVHLKPKKMNSKGE